MTNCNICGAPRKKHWIDGDGDIWSPRTNEKKRNRICLLAEDVWGSGPEPIILEKS